MFTTPLNVSLLLLAGAGTGVLGAILGTGGGVFLVPILVLGFGIPVHYAVATSIVSVIATSSAVAGSNVERGSANMPLGMTLEIATTLGAIAGGFLAGHLSAGVLQGLFAVVLLPTAWLMWQGRGETPTLEDEKNDAAAAQAAGATAQASPSAPDEAPRAELLEGEYYDEHLGRLVPYTVQRLWAGLIVSFFAGNFSGLLGIGGGVFKVPALHLLCGLPIRVAAATSNFMIGVTAAAGAFLYFGRGEVRPALTAATVLGVLLGALIGLRLSRHLHSEWVARLFAVLLAAVAVQMAWHAFAAGE